MKGMIASLILMLGLIGSADAAGARKGETLRVQVNHEKRFAKSREAACGSAPRMD